MRTPSSAQECLSFAGHAPASRRRDGRGKSAAPAPAFDGDGAAAASDGFDASEGECECACACALPFVENRGDKLALDAAPLPFGLSACASAKCPLGVRGVSGSGAGG